jgi:hypothetical protein
MRLSQFLNALRDTLELILYQRPDLFGLHGGAFQALWPGVRERFKAVQDDALKPDQQLPTNLKELPDRLADHGLTGEELTLKLNIFSSLLLAFLDELERREDAEAFWKTWDARLEVPEPTGGVLRRAIRGRVRAALATTRRIMKGGLRQVLGAADVVLGSLGDALSFIPGPNAAAAAIKEFKDAADAVLVEPDEAERPSRRTVWREPEPSPTGVPTFATLRQSASALSSSPRRQ